MKYSILKYFPVIEENGNTYCGGNQEWYGQEWQRKAGCASVCGANIATYYWKKENHHTDTFSKTDYIERMSQLYKYMKPGMRGFPDPYKFLSRFLKYQNSKGYICKGSIYHDWKSYLQAKQYIIQSLKEENPVALLILMHTAPVMKENNWHWMTIVEYDDEQETFSISNLGKIETYKAEEVFEPLKGNQVWLVSFEQPQFM